MKQVLSLLFLVSVISLLACGGAGDSSNNLGNGDDAPIPIQQINAEKLIGTPFEGRTRGDDIPFYFFLCNQYQTNEITGFPILIFAAFFTPFEEERIREGIQIANDAVGFEMYEYTDDWHDTNRVIYRVNLVQNGDGTLYDAVGHTQSDRYKFNGKFYSETIQRDWTIELLTVSSGLVAHELGHATGLDHWLTNYENDTFSDLKPDSIMNVPRGPSLEEYNFMMQKQGEIFLNHLNERTPDSTRCNGVPSTL